ncbi:MAG: hypothetical protein QG552_681, partial [Thermodesulfobacteriota bacterium]|nr:hypothetical protein [Thermodesulfobacteriota bacterium]
PRSAFPNLSQWLRAQAIFFWMGLDSDMGHSTLGGYWILVSGYWFLGFVEFIGFVGFTGLLDFKL